jgi:hypothetical protein
MRDSGRKISLGEAAVLAYGALFLACLLVVLYVLPDLFKLSSSD